MMCGSGPVTLLFLARTIIKTSGKALLPAKTQLSLLSGAQWERKRKIRLDTLSFWASNPFVNGHYITLKDVKEDVYIFTFGVQFLFGIIIIFLILQHVFNHHWQWNQCYKPLKWFWLFKMCLKFSINKNSTYQCD